MSVVFRPRVPAALRGAVRSWARDELPLALEVAALSAFVIARPVLASFGAAPEVFIAESARSSDIVVFAVVVVFGPVALAAVGGSMLRIAGERVRRTAHLVAVGGLAALAVWQIVAALVHLPVAVTALLGVAGGVALGAWRARGAIVATFLRYSAAAVAVFLAQFAFASPSSSLIWHEMSAAVADPGTTAAVSASIGADAPPIVVVVLDELPTGTLLDGSGHIDDDLFPNIARLAGDGTWFRNHTTVSASTAQALSAIVTGRYPDRRDAPTAREHPDNLFTLLAGAYDLHVLEQLTAFCPSPHCRSAGSRAHVPALLADGVGFWGRYMVRGGSPGIPTRSGDRLAELEGWTRDQSFERSGRPDLFFVHTVLPHVGWEYLPDGTRYRADPLPTGVLPGHVWSDRGTLVGRQRHVMQTQAVDRALGRLLDRLDAAGVYRDALVVLTADHGAAFVPGEPRRSPTEAQFDQIAWTPLVVKAPGQQSGGVVRDDNVQNIDILPTVLDLVGVEGAPPVDGHPIADVPGRDSGGGHGESGKWMMPPGDDLTTLEPSGDDGRIRLDAEEGMRRVLATRPVTGTGPDGVWDLVPGRPLVGRDLADLRVGDVADASVDPGFDDAFERLAPEGPVALEIDTTATVPAGTPVVAVVNGVVSGSTLAERAEGGGAHVQVMVRPDALVAGDNDVRLYVVGDGPGAVTLRELLPDG